MSFKSFPELMLKSDGLFSCFLKTTVTSYDDLKRAGPN